MTSFYEPTPDGLRATELTRGPWDDRFQHGGPPNALLARAIEELEGAQDFVLARYTASFKGPIPITTVSVRVELEHGGRSTQRVRAVLEAAGRPVLEATGLRVRRSTVDVTEGPPPSTLTSPWPDPTSLDPYTFTFFQHDVGYHRAVDLRLASGAWGRTPVRFWARPTVALVQDTPWSPRQAVIALADAQSGMGVPLDPKRFGFANPDLSVAFARTPVGDWTGLDIRSLAGPEGVGQVQSDLVDREGWLGGSSQTLVVRARA